MKPFKLVHGEVMKNKLRHNQIKLANNRAHSLDQEDNNHISSLKSKFRFHFLQK